MGDFGVRKGNTFMSVGKDATKLMVSIPYAPSGDIQCSLVVPASTGQRVIPGLPICAITAL